MAVKFDPIKLTDHFYQIGTPYFPGYLSLGKKNMLIDGGTGAVAGIIQGQIRALEIDPNSIEYMAITHSHADHIGALSRLKKRWTHLKTIASEGAAKMMENPKVIKQFEGMDSAISKIMKAASEIEEIPTPMESGGYDFGVNIVADETTRIDLGNNIVWTVGTAPGHAACQIILFEEYEGTAVIGDSAGFYNPVEKAFWPNYFDSLGDYTDSIRKIIRINPARLALGHNGAVEKDIKAFLASALQATGVYHRELVKRVGDGETFEAIALDKARQISSWSGHMSFAVVMLIQVLIKQSLKAAGDGEPSFELDFDARP
nr:MBL fold metallo-hydrolase [Desulfobacula sp.]